MLRPSTDHLQGDILNILVSTHIACGTEIRFLQGFVTSWSLNKSISRLKLKIKLTFKNRTSYI